MAKKGLIGWASLVLLTVQNVSHIMVLRQTRIRTDMPLYLSSTAVVVCECIKLLVSLLMLLTVDGWKYAIRRTMEDPIDCIKIAVPAIVYLIQNNLLILALSNLDAAVFQVTYQLKVLTTALFSVFLLGKRISPVQWISLLLLFVGVSIVQFEPSKAQSSTNAPNDSQNQLLGLIFVIVASMLSGFAGIYFEKTLKASTTSLWLRNVQLASIGIVLGLGGQFLYESDKIQSQGYFVGFDWLVWLMVALQSIGGVIVAIVVKYADNILKGFACSAAIVLSCLLSVFIFHVNLSIQVLMGASLVAFSIGLYSYGASQPLTDSKPIIKKD